VELAAQVVEALGVADEMNFRLGVHDSQLPDTIREEMIVDLATSWYEKSWP
jgi:hypothetical protein